MKVIEIYNCKDPLLLFTASSMEAGKRRDDENIGKPTPKRISVKSLSHFNYPVWKQKLRENCFRRVREDRSRLLWRFRISDSQLQSSDEKDFIQSALQDIVCDEMKKMEDSSRGEPSMTPDSGDILWEYQGTKDAYVGGDSEEMLLEMQRIFYEDLVSNTTATGSCFQMETWEEEEDDYLATLVFENMHLNHEEDVNQIWCPICKQGEVKENQRHVYCNACDMQLNRGDGVQIPLHMPYFTASFLAKSSFFLSFFFNCVLYLICLPGKSSHSATTVGGRSLRTCRERMQIETQVLHSVSV